MSSRTSCRSAPSARARAEAAGIRPRADRSLDAGLDLGKTRASSRSCCCARPTALVALGYPVLLSASNKRFLGELLELEVDDRREATLAAHALGIALGCRILRAHDVQGARRTADVLAALLEARRTRRSLHDRSPPAGWRSRAPRRRRATLVHELVGDEDRALVVDDITDDDYEVARIVDAARTPPFLTSRRVVVARHIGQFARQDDVAPLIDYVADPLDTTELVLVAGGTVHRALVDAVKKQKGEITDTDPGRAAREWLKEQFDTAAVKLDAVRA